MAAARPGTHAFVERINDDSLGILTSGLDFFADLVGRPQPVTANVVVQVYESMRKCFLTENQMAVAF